MAYDQNLDVLVKQFPTHTLHNGDSIEVSVKRYDKSGPNTGKLRVAVQKVGKSGWHSNDLGRLDADDAVAVFTVALEAATWAQKQVGPAVQKVAPKATKKVSAAFVSKLVARKSTKVAVPVSKASKRR